MSHHRPSRKPSLALFAFAISLILSGVAAADDGALTLFGWSDQHVKTNGDASHLLATIEAMNQLPGVSYPKAISGKVQVPTFVTGCGDVTEWPTRAAVRSYDELVRKNIKYPCYDVMGNHDEGGKVPNDQMKKWIISRHGSLSYSHDKGGVHFIGLFSKFDANADNPA
ncbi:MAG: hypothetical protein N2C14_26900 [Planctomycetales bacterium]